jgi:hypothetical protein
MAGEVTVPLLPCADVTEVVAFYEALGFRRTYHQKKPNPYVVVRREDWELHFFGMAGFDPEQSYGSCVVQVPDVGALHEAFVTGLRARYGRVPVRGVPRMTRPRRRKNSGNLSGFSVVDPGGNWIRIFPAGATEEEAPPRSGLGAALDNAVVLGDSKGDHAQAAKVLDGALTRHPGAPERTEALLYRVELARRAGDDTRAGELLAELRTLPLTDAERDQLADLLPGGDAGGLGAEQ